MQYITDLNKMPPIGASAVTLGKFDGIHRGHQTLIREAVLAKKKGLTPCAFIMDGSECHLLTRDERLRMLEEAGIELVVELPLNEHFRQQSAEAFAINVLWGRLKAKEVIVGENYAFGRNRKGDASLLTMIGEETGFQTKAMPLVFHEGQKISSSVIREALEKGDMPFVNACLGYRYYIRGEVISGKHLGRTLGVPTTNIVPPTDQYLPPNGVYASLVTIDGRVWKGMTNIGVKPTVEGENMGVETYLFDCDEDFYGQIEKVELCVHTRPEARYGSLEELKERLEKDKKEVIDIMLTIH